MVVLTYSVSRALSFRNHYTAVFQGVSAAPEAEVGYRISISGAQDTSLCSFSWRILLSRSPKGIEPTQDTGSPAPKPQASAYCSNSLGGSFGHVQSATWNVQCIVSSSISSGPDIVQIFFLFCASVLVLDSASAQLVRVSVLNEGGIPRNYF